MVDCFNNFPKRPPNSFTSVALRGDRDFHQPQPTTSDETNFEQPVGSPKKSQSAKAIQARLVAQISELLGVATHKINVRESFSAFRLNWVEAVILTGELGEWLERDLSPTLAYDHLTIESLAQHLAEELHSPI